jgi:hypothetical protein
VVDEQRALGAGKQHVRLVRELGQAAHGGVVVWHAGCDGGPRLAEVGGLDDVGLEVAVTMGVERYIGGAARGRRRDDLADERPVLHACDRVTQLRPRGAGVRRQLHVAVIGADPEDLGVERRFGDVRDLADRVAVVARELDVAIQDAHHLDGVAVDRARQIFRARPRRTEVL